VKTLIFNTTNDSFLFWGIPSNMQKVLIHAYKKVVTYEHQTEILQTLRLDPRGSMAYKSEKLQHHRPSSTHKKLSFYFYAR